jgi:hypothetical protein
MTFESALTALARSRADLSDVVEALCSLAESANAVGDRQRRDDTVDVTARLIAEGARPSVRA